jgi:nitrate/nitrite-specific signal transduction histidine kinase
MRERAEELGGIFRVETPPSGGTEIIVDLPCRIGDEQPATATGVQES